MKSRKTNVSKPRRPRVVVEQYALDLGDGAPRTVALDGRTGRPLGARRSAGIATRDDALQQVIENEKKAWRELHDRELAAFLTEKGSAAFLAEDFRRWFMERGNEGPHHPNVWGAMWMASARHGLLIKTGKYRHMKDVRSHARITTEWMKEAQ